MNISVLTALHACPLCQSRGRASCEREFLAVTFFVEAFPKRLATGLSHERFKSVVGAKSTSRHGKRGRMATQGNNWLNYHHLYYFWRVAHEGSLSRAAEQLRLSHSTISAQIRLLEDHLRGELFLRSGRALTLTTLGHDILHYADEIFRLGMELSESVSGLGETTRAPLHLGVVSTVARPTVYKLLEPILQPQEQGPMHLYQGSLDQLLERMAAGGLHLILSDEPPPQGLALHVYSRTLLETGVCIRGARPLAGKFREQFPHSLEGAPMLLPMPGSGLRQRLDAWLAAQEVSVRVVGEFEDIETMRVFGQRGQGLFLEQLPLIAEDSYESDSELVGWLPGIKESIYALSPERRAHRLDVKRILESTHLPSKKSPRSTRS